LLSLCACTCLFEEPQGQCMVETGRRPPSRCPVGGNTAERPWRNVQKRHYHNATSSSTSLSAMADGRFEQAQDLLANSILARTQDPVGNRLHISPWELSGATLGSKASKDMERAASEPMVAWGAARNQHEKIASNTASHSINMRIATKASDAPHDQLYKATFTSHIQSNGAVGGCPGSMNDLGLLKTHDKQGLLGREGKDPWSVESKRPDASRFASHGKGEPGRIMPEMTTKRILADFSRENSLTTKVALEAHRRALSVDPDAFRREHSEMTHYARLRNQTQCGSMQPNAHPYQSDHDLARGLGHRGFLAPNGHRQKMRHTLNHRPPARGTAYNPPNGLPRQPRVQTPMYPSAYRGPSCAYVACGGPSKRVAVSNALTGSQRVSESSEYLNNGTLASTFDSFCRKDGEGMAFTFPSPQARPGSRVEILHH